MSQEGAAKLRLKPRKAPPEPSPGQDPPGRHQTVTDKCYWFEKEDLSECEKTWILLMKTVNPDLKGTNWQTAPSFPEFFGKSLEEENLQQSEVLKIGTGDFQWILFPPFHKEKHINPKDLNSPQLTESQTDHLLDSYSQADEPNCLSSTAEKACCIAFKDHTKNVVGENSKGILKLDANLKSCKLGQHKYSTYQIDSAQSSAKQPLGFPQPCKGTAQNNRERKENSSSMSQVQTHEGSVSFGEARSMPAKRTSLVSTPGTESCNRKTGDHSEGALALDSCPICLVQFSGTLSQLDIDGHLARCLSESTDDVVW